MRRRTGNRLAGAAAGAACVLLASACTASSVPPAAVTQAAAPASSSAARTVTGSGPVCSAFELELVEGVSGQPTPVDAARWLAAHGRVGGVPQGGWQEVRRNPTGAAVRSGDWTLHAVQGADRTWRVDSGQSC